MTVILIGKPMDLPSVGTTLNGAKGKLFRLVGLADDGLAGGGDHGQAHLFDSRAVHVLLHHDDGNEHDGSSNAAEYKTNDSEAATVGHDPLPQIPLRLFSRQSVNGGSSRWVNFA